MTGTGSGVGDGEGEGKGVGDGEEVGDTDSVAVAEGGVLLAGVGVSTDGLQARVTRKKRGTTIMVFIDLFIIVFDWYI